MLVFLLFIQKNTLAISNYKLKHQHKSGAWYDKLSDIINGLKCHISDIYPIQSILDKQTAVTQALI